MPIDQFAVDFRRSVQRVDPMQPIFAVIALIATIVFAWHNDRASGALAWIGVALIVVVVVGSIVVAEPINSKFRRLPEGELPDRAEYCRTVWRRFHAGRAIVALAAFACVAAAAVT